MLYKYMDALCGTSGAGQLVNEILLARLNGALETIYFNELDYIFGNLNFMSRSPAETYTYNPMVDMLTSDQWDEVRVKDAWYRDRLQQFFIACSKGGTPDGIRTCVRAAIAVECDLFEIWRYVDNFGLGDDLGRAPTSARNELVIRPHKTSLLPQETRLLRDMLEKIKPLDVIITISLEGLGVVTPVSISAATADSTYYEVQKMVTATPLIDQLPPPELLPIDLLPTEQWLYLATTDPQLAPYTAFNISSEYGYYYLVGDGRSPIDAVTYGTLSTNGETINTEPNFEVFSTEEQFTEWTIYERADSPDNYPGGKYGLHPSTAPAIYPDHSPYDFPWEAQIQYVLSRIQEVLALGGRADENRYCLPLSATTQAKRVYWPEYAIASDAPARDTTVSASITRRRYSPGIAEMRDPIVFVRGA